MFEITGNGLTEQQEESKSEVAEAKIFVPAHTRKPKRKLEELCADLPVEEAVCDLPENERFNAQAEQLRRIGKECVRAELCREKAKAWVNKYYSMTYADPRAERETGYADIQKAPTPAPAPLLQHSYVSASVVTDVVIRSMQTPCRCTVRSRRGNCLFFSFG